MRSKERKNIPICNLHPCLSAGLRHLDGTGRVLELGHGHEILVAG